jgi:hypothetical protein
MKQLNNILFYSFCLIVLILILLMLKEYPSFNKTNFTQSFSKI